MSTTREIQIEDQHGVMLSVTMDENGVIKGRVDPEGFDFELDETDRRDLADFLNGAR